MTAVLGQILGSALPAGVISMISRNPANWSRFIQRALAAGYGIGDVLDVLQPDEGGTIGRTRERIQRRTEAGVVTPFEEGIQTKAPPRVGQGLGRLAATGGVVATLANLGGPSLGGPSASTAQTMPPPHPNASPANQRNPLAKMLKSKSGLGAADIQQQAADRGPNQIEKIAPRAYRDAQYIMSGGRSAEEAADLLRKQAGRDQQLAKDLSKLSKQFKRPLASILSAYVPVEQPQEETAAAAETETTDDEEAIIAELQKLIAEL